jgi:NADH-quinone oxidoreductase subunit H
MTDFLRDIGLSHGLAVLIAKTIGVFVVGAFGLLWTLLGIWIERKLAGRFQDRLGPNRVGPFGIVQSIADTVKIIIKEDIMNTGVDRWVFNIAPILSVTSVILLWAVIPFSTAWIGSNLDIGVLYLVAVGGLGTVAVIMAGWSSNNKYALVSAFRAVAQLISYEVPMVMALLVPVLLSGSMSTQGIVHSQHIMYLFAVPVTVLIFLTSSQAETGRGPFDLLEAESELVSGFHIEYSGMKFGMFYAGELLHAFTFGGFWSILIFGGYRFFGLELVSPFLAIPILLFKATIGYWIIMWVKYTMMRIRIDHMLAFNWKFLTPLSFVLLMVTALVSVLLRGTSPWVYGLGMFLSNAVLGWIVIEFLRRYSRSEREKVEGRAKPVMEAAGH